MPEANDRFMLKMFRRYYRANSNPWMPDRFTKKEYGFIPFGGTMRRHMAFTSQDDLRIFLATKVPRHSYYSTAYYRHPDKPVMEEKEWMGAELIFDLDADHLEGADDMTYSEMMVQIRNEMISLVDDYLLGDFGFSVDQVHICFSGGRGYHAHVRSNDIYTLGTHERRELVDYISCAGLDMDWVFPVHKEPVRTSTYKDEKYTSTQDYRLIPSEDTGGWKSKMRKALEVVIHDAITEKPSDFRKKYPSVKSTSDTLTRLSERLEKIEGSMFETGSMFGLTKPQQDILIKALEDIKFTLSSEIDKPVTPDIKRLIRLPESLHGKTGLRVSKITREQLTDYDPLQDAIPDSYTDDPVKITMRRDVSLKMRGETFALKGETEAPEYAAAFLIGKKYADYGWESERLNSFFRMADACFYDYQPFPMHGRERRQAPSHRQIP